MQVGKLYRINKSYGSVHGFKHVEFFGDIGMGGTWESLNKGSLLLYLGQAEFTNNEARTKSVRNARPGESFNFFVSQNHKFWVHYFLTAPGEIISGVSTSKAWKIEDQKHWIEPAIAVATED